MQAAMKTTLYQILGVPPDASREQIAAAYRTALGAGRSAGHPDPNATFLRDAYQILSNDAHRAAYDASLARAQRGSGAAVPVVDERGKAAWVPWLVAALLLVGGVTAWQWRKAPVQPAARDTVSVAEKEEPRSEPTETAAPAPARSTETAPAVVQTRPRTAEEIFVQLAPSVARVIVLDGAGVPIGSGSGVVIDREAVITNCHVAIRARQLSVRIGNETSPATVSMADEQFDLCRLYVPGLRAPAVEMGGVGSLRTGQKVFTIGAPQGLDLTISEGIVSSLREVPEGTVIQTTAPISPGSSGGGLFNGAGQLVGITTFQHRYGQNLNFALPADWIARMQARSSSPAQPGRFVTAPVAGGDPAVTIVGKWLCYGPLTGRSGEYTFAEDGTMSAVLGGKAAVGQYALRGKALYLAGAGTLAIEEISAQKMILNAGEGRRLVCQRA
jgi:S1-C subfamily serine protease